MEQTRKEIGETRAHTDASLSAERASTDTASDRALARSQRVLDDLLERDRIVADEQLSKFRDSADLVLLHEREVSPARDSAVAVERKLADEGRQAERDATDALLEGERRRADENMDAEREERVKHRVRHGVRRQATDQQLTNERSGADEAESVHDETKHALQRAQADQARNRDVLAMVTHDLRSPLSVIAMNAQHIVTITKEDSTREAADDMMRSAARMARLLADLLDVARIESNTLRIVEREHDVGTLLGEVSRTYQPLFAARTMTFVLQQPATPIVASFDHDRIVQVLSNLLGNAMKFNAPRATVLLRVERRADEIEFVLTDTGPGIHPSALPHVFERFCQIDEESRRGLGLGLYICEKIVAAHGGRISAESELGKGATFRFTLPLR